MRIYPDKTAWVLTEYTGHEAAKVFVRGIFTEFEQLNQFVGDPAASDSEWCAQLFVGSELRQQRYMSEAEWVDQPVFGCEAEQDGDTIVCHKCRQAWPVDSPDPPTCMFLTSREVKIEDTPLARQDQ